MSDIKKLVNDLVYKGTKELWFDPKNYETKEASNNYFYSPFFSGYVGDLDIPFKVRLPLSIEEKELKIDAVFGSETGYITIQPGNEINYDVRIDTQNEEIEYILTYHYTQSLTKKSDVALILKTYSAFDFINLLKYINIKPASEAFINDEFRKAFSRVESDDDKLSWLYENAYPSAIKDRKDEQLWNDLLRLSKYDGEKWFVDTGSAIMNIAQSFSNIKWIIDKLKANQETLMEVYSTISNYNTKSAFSTLINAFIISEGNSLRKPVFLKGSLYRIYEFAPSIENKLFRIVNQKIISTKIIASNMGAVTSQDFVTIEEADLNPCDLVIIEDTDIKTSLKKPIKTAPSAAIMLHYMVDNADHEAWVKILRLTLDVAAILTAVYSGGTSSVLIRFAEAGLALTDIAMMDEGVRKFLSDNGGEWFVENWDTIYLMAGLGFLSRVIINGILAKGPALLESLTNVKNIPKNWALFRKDLEKLIKELEAYEARQAAVITNEIEEVVIKGDKYGLWRKILNLISSPEKYIEQIVKDLKSKNIALENIAENSYAISYKGLKIREGNQYLIGENLRSIHFSEGKKFFRIIMPWVNREVVSNFTHKATSGAKLTGYEDLGTFLVGSFGSDLQYVLKQMYYPELTDKMMLEAGYPFNLPKYQKFNLLNVSNDIYEEAIKRGGFFTQVNSKWVDAAVTQNVEVVIMSEFNNLRAPVFEKGVQVGEKLTGFGKEIHRFEWKHNYRFNPKTKRMVPPTEARGLKTLTKFEEYTIKN